MNNINPPVIIIGMHRSGTSFLTRALEEEGLFMGERVEGNDESTFFLALNNWIIKQCGGSWGEPAPTLLALRNDKFRAFIVEHIKFRMKSIQSVEYWGRHFLSNNFFSKGDIHWGWKDPRNTFTLDIWKQLYPDLKVIAIRRHGLDVALSLKKRSDMWMDSYMRSTGFRRLKKNIKLQFKGYGDSYKSRDLMDGLTLWECYENQVDQVINKYGSDVLLIKYEDLTDKSLKVSSSVADFLGFVNAERLNVSIQSSFDSSRVHSYKDKAIEGDVIEKSEVILNKFGYSISA